MNRRARYASGNRVKRGLVLLVTCGACFGSGSLSHAQTAKPTLDLIQENGFQWLAYLDPQVSPTADFSSPQLSEVNFVPWAVTATNGDWSQLLASRGQANGQMHGWLRLHVTLPAEWSQKDRGNLRLFGFNFDAVDQTYFNGLILGKTGIFPDSATTGLDPKPDVIRSYTVPSDLVNWDGDNVIAIHGYHDGGAGAFTLARPKLEATLIGSPGFIWGDLNGDGKVNVSDATISLQIAVGARTTIPQDDVNRDESQNLQDTTMILQYAVGLLSHFPPGVKTNTIEIRADGFHPASIVVAVGSKVTWTNRDPGLHGVTSGVPDQPDGLFDTGTFAQDVGQTETFTDPGVYPYFDSQNPDLRGTVIVQ